MFESGVGRALNLQFASQSIFQFPGDISGSDRYYYEDIIMNPAKVVAGTLKVPQGEGIGVKLDWTTIERYTYSSDKFLL